MSKNSLFDIERYFSSKEACLILGISEEHLKRLDENGITTPKHGFVNSYYKKSEILELNKIDIVTKW